MNNWLVMIPIGIILVALTHLFIGEHLRIIGMGIGFILMIIGFVKAYSYKPTEVKYKT